MYHQEILNRSELSKSKALSVGWPESSPDTKATAPDHLILFARADYVGLPQYISGAIVCSKRDFEKGINLQLVLVPIRE